MIRHPSARRTFKLLDARARDPSVNVAAKAVWRIIDTYCDKQGTGAYPSLSRIAKHASLNPRSVMRAIEELEAAGWLEVIRVEGKSNSYIVFYEPVTKRARVTHDKNGSGTSDKNDTLSHTSTQRVDFSSQH